MDGAALTAATRLATLLALTRTAPGDAGPDRGPRDFRVHAYDLELSIDRAHERVAGRERLHLRSAQPGLATLAFPLNGIEVSSVAAAGRPLPYAVADGALVLRPSQPLAAGEELEVTIAYEARKPKGVTFGPAVVYTAFSTCHWMVCRDRPDDRASFRLTIDVPAGETLVASGSPIEARGHTWSEDAPSAPYLFGFALGRMTKTTRQQGGVTFEYFLTGEDEAWRARVFADDERMLAFFVEKAGRPWPRAVYRQVVVDGGVAQEVSSFSILGREGLDPRLADPQEDWLVAHEMAHQVWGNLLTAADWSQLWLNEGITSFLVAAYKERRWGRAAYERELDHLRRRHRSAVDAGLDLPLTFPGEYPSLTMKRAITYAKAALFLDRLRAAMGERAFWGALATYTRAFAERPVTSEDFERTFAAATDVDLSPLFNGWVDGP
ncbi:MAG TPA: M1 family aminopeptidase [Polyangia bacterium]|nr:M1 family aminopeptidase [Polyangia bacterium]